jgi:hypothetical protein
MADPRGGCAESGRTEFRPLGHGKSAACVRLRSRPASCSREQTADEPAPSLRPHYRGFTATTSRSAGARRDGTPRLPVSAAQRSPSRTRRPRRSARRGIGTRLPMFRAAAADQAHAASMPDTAWPVNGHPPGSSRSRIDAPVSMSFPKSRHLISGSLAFVFPVPI